MEEFNTDFLLVIQSICPGRCSGRVSLVDDVVEIVLVVVFDFEKRFGGFPSNSDSQRLGLRQRERGHAVEVLNPRVTSRRKLDAAEALAIPKGHVVAGRGDPFDIDHCAEVDDLDALVLVLGISVQLLHEKSSPFVLNESFAR